MVLLQVVQLPLVFLLLYPIQEETEDLIADKPLPLPELQGLPQTWRRAVLLPVPATLPIPLREIRHHPELHRLR